jgi:UDP-N-acetylglucosamine 2-epimerase (non-hydrolysing)
MKQIAPRIPIVFSVHPRTRANISRFGLSELLQDQRILLIEPLGYLDFLKLEMDAKFVMTDSGGIQEETTMLGIPCLNLRDTTERPITVTQGTNTVVGNDTARIVTEAFKILNGEGKKGTCPDFRHNCSTRAECKSREA